MSALPPKADIGTQSRNVRFVPKADISPVGHSIIPLPVYFAISNAASLGMETP
jgi:hypothetical protein